MAFMLPSTIGARRPLWRPPGIANINWDDPYAEKLLFCVVPDGTATPVDLAGNYPPFTITRNASPRYSSAPTPAGQGIKFNGTTQGLGSVAPVGLGQLGLAAGAGCTMLAVIYPVGSVGVNGIVFNFAQAGNSSVAIGMLILASNGLGMNIGGTAFTFTGATYNPNAINVIVMTYHNSTSVLFQNGKRTSIGTTGSGITTAQAGIGAQYRNNSFGASTYNGEILLTALWRGVLPDAVIWNLISDPFRFLTFPQDNVLQTLRYMAPMTSHGNMLMMFN